jgi:S-formylglutathione hydrolase FrmB
MNLNISIMKNLSIHLVLTFLFLINPFSNKVFSADMLSNKDTTLDFNGIKTDILYPSSMPTGTILVLPGWNFTRDDICQKSKFCKLAGQLGFVLVMPDMLKSVYASKLFPETRKEWINYPQLHWIIDTLIPSLQNSFHLLQPGQNNFLFGISTGGRGVAMLAIYSKHIFIAGAALSGDYNQTEMTADKLITGYYGEFNQFPERWKSDDNPYNNAEKIDFPLFLAHGRADNVDPYYQTEEFFNKLNSLHPELRHKLVLVENAGHNYDFWSSRYEDVFNFFLGEARIRVLNGNKP